MMLHLSLAVVATALLFRPVAGDAASTNRADGLSEMIGHWVNVFLGGKTKRAPTKVKLAIVGLPRTGTGSLVEALSLLDYTTLHADEYIELSDLFASLTDESDPITMEQFTGGVGERGFDAVYYWNADFIQWAAEADDVKVILTSRDTPTKWAESYQSVGVDWDGILLSRPFVWFKAVQQMALTLRNLREAVRGDDIRTLEESYSNHFNMVREVVPEDKLLVFNAKMGWGPLCEFLKDDAAKCDELREQPFPHANERWVLQLENNICWLITWIWPMIAIVILWAIWWMCSCVFGTKKTKAKES